MTMHRAVRDGITLAYLDTGAGEPPFVFVHGWTCNHTHLAPQIEHFAAEHRVVAVDLRGHGESDAPEQRYTVQALADDVAWLCNLVHVERPVLVGHSMGGQVVLEVAASHPDLACAVVLIDAAPIVAGSPAIEMAAEFGAALDGPDGCAAREALADHAVAALARVPDLQARVRSDMLRTPHHVAVSCVMLMGEWDGAFVHRSRLAHRCRGSDQRRGRAACAQPAAADGPDGGCRTLQPARGARAGQRDDRAVPRGRARVIGAVAVAPSCAKCSRMRTT